MQCKPGFILCQFRGASICYVEDQAVLIIGYDEHNTILYQPMENSARKMGLQDSDTFFGESGNVFLGYLEK